MVFFILKCKNNIKCSNSLLIFDCIVSPPLAGNQPFTKLKVAHGPPVDNYICDMSGHILLDS